MLQQFRQLFQIECQTPEFRQTVKQIFHNETHKFRIREMASDEIRYLLPKAIDNTVIPKVNSRLQNFVKEDLTRLVNKQLDENVPNYLSNHAIMQAILTRHSQQLDEQLTITANEIMNKIVNDPQHQQLVNLRFSEIDKKNNSKLKALEQKVDNKLSDINQLQVKVNKLERQNNLLRIMIVGSFLLTMIMMYYLANKK